MTACADWMRRLHPLRLQYEMFSGQQSVHARPGSIAEQVREDRQTVGARQSVLAGARQSGRSRIEEMLDGYRDVRDQHAKRSFHAVYGSPLLQAMVGLKASDASPRRHPAPTPNIVALVAQRIAELKRAHRRGRTARGRDPRAALRPAGRGAVDERGFNLLRRMRDERAAASRSASSRSSCASSSSCCC